jgi:DNA-directed RNA polymerase specialized sigma24 family protein
MGSFDDSFNRYIELVTTRMLDLIRKCGIRDGAEHDVYQETCLKFYRWLSHLELHEPGQNPAQHERMLRTMAVQCTIDELRRRKAEPRLLREESRPDDEDDGEPERIFGPGLEPHPERLLLNREKDQQRLEFLAAVAKCRGGKVLEGLLSISKGCSPSETVGFIECYLFHSGLTGDGPRSDLTDQLCAQRGITENGVATNCFRLRPAWVRLKWEILGEEVRTGRWARKFKARRV